MPKQNVHNFRHWALQNVEYGEGSQSFLFLAERQRFIFLFDVPRETEM